MQTPYMPLPMGFVNVNYNDFAAIKEAAGDKTCAVMLELVQGEGGVYTPDEGYLKAVRKWCEENNILFILDEIQTGMGRLGTLWGYEQFGIEPDIMVIAKGLANGVPIGALLAKEAVSVFVAGDHGSTFGGNPLACAAGYATLKYVLENNIPASAKNVGGYFFAGLEKLKRKYSFITEVRGRGLLLAVEFNKDMAPQVFSTCLNNGLLANKVKPNAIRFVPPLIITRGDADEALDILDRVFAEIGV